MKKSPGSVKKLTILASVIPRGSFMWPMIDSITFKKYSSLMISILISYNMPYQRQGLNSVRFFSWGSLPGGPMSAIILLSLSLIIKSINTQKRSNKCLQTNMRKGSKIGLSYLTMISYLCPSMRKDYKSWNCWRMRKFSRKSRKKKKNYLRNKNKLEEKWNSNMRA